MSLEEELKAQLDDTMRQLDRDHEQLKLLEAEKRVANQEWDTAYEQFKTEHAELFDRLDTARHTYQRAVLQVAQGETKAKELALSIYHCQDDDAMSDKHPHDALEIRLYDEMVYDHDAAYLWCLNHCQAALKFDDKVYAALLKDAKGRPALQETGFALMPGFVQKRPKAIWTTAYTKKVNGEAE